MKLDKTYEPSKYESDIYSKWENAGVFNADNTSDKPHFSISMPPPNETGTLHVGHALFLTLQDIMARHARQTGHDVLWLPGTDHAALATNAIIEKRLAEQGTDKHAVGREEFIRQVKEFVGDSRQTIIGQIRAMGASCDWGRARYTLDDSLNRLTAEVFSKMYHDGLIYRGHRIVNWDPNLETTVSDDEVVRKEEKAPFYTLQYGPFQISTARPETKFGDKYVVMHPDDERYAQYKPGDTFEAQWLNGTVTATVIKDEAVNRTFGTGVMTITPWHDHTDFEIAERHGLEKEQIIDFEGKLLPIAGEFAGLGIAEARPKIVEKLDSLGLLVNVDENYVHSLAINDRGKGVIEPQIKLQWFVDVNRPAMEWKGQMRSLREVMRAVVEDGDIEIIPKKFEKDYYRWIDNLRDWCVSRQIWWGHQIPAWHRAGDNADIHVGLNAPEGDGWSQDPDTLDTWFSSALWTWSTLVDPELAKDSSIPLEQLLERSPDFKAYHPTSVMETGWDILFFWVARMILATTYATGQVPFKQVYLHGLVRTEAGKKMSKSDPDSIIDPMEVIEEFGTDALRLALVSGVTAGNDMRMGKAKIVANRNFCNKLWNVSRYIEGVVGDSQLGELVLKSEADHWILNKLSIFTDEVKHNLANFQFSESYDLLYHFIWNDFADWYIEASKTEPNNEVLTHVLKHTLTITHPFAPFLTEAIWQSLGWNSELLASQPWPELAGFDEAKAKEFEKIKSIVSEVRWLGAMSDARPEKLHYNREGQGTSGPLIAKLAGLKEVSQRPADYSGGVVLNADWVLDIDPAQVKENLNAKKAELEGSVANLQKRLDNEAYRSKAPAELITETENQIAESKTSLEHLSTVLNSI
jgi:valyl-tRNA synthetase